MIWELGMFQDHAADTPDFMVQRRAIDTTIKPQTRLV